jgi:hypothetical protein
VSDVVTRVLEALNAHDVDAFVECYAEHATIEDGYDDVVARGHTGLRARYAPLLTDYPDARWAVLTRIESGEFVVQHEEVTGRGDTTRHVCVYLVREGLVVRERIFR